MTAVRDVCTYCKADVLILRTLSGKYWPFDATFHDARLIPSGRAFGVKRREGQPTAIALDSTDTTPDGRVLTRHWCEDYRARGQDIEGSANLLRPTDQLAGAKSSTPRR